MIKRRSIRRFVLAALIVLIAGYALFEARGLLRGPAITIESPTSGQTVTEPLVHIIGVASNIKAISMNGRTISISEEGAIDEPVALLAGYNELLFVGTDRFGKTTRVELVVTYKPAAAMSLPARVGTSTPAETATGTATTTATSSEGF